MHRTWVHIAGAVVALWLVAVAIGQIFSPVYPYGGLIFAVLVVVGVVWIRRIAKRMRELRRQSH